VWRIICAKAQQQTQWKLWRDYSSTIKNIKLIKMKKILMIIIVTFVTVNLNAQWFIGGNVGLRVVDRKSSPSDQMTEIGFDIASKAGYYFNEKLAVGLNFSIGYEYYKRPSGSPASFSIWMDAIQWSACPFVRYSVFTYKKFAVVLEGSTGVGGRYIGSGFDRGDDFYPDHQVRFSTLGIRVLNVAPILSYNLSDHFQLEAGLYFLNLGYNIDIIGNKGDNKIMVHDFNIGFRSSSIISVGSLTIGAIYKF
jgi:hypothetical protein